MVKVYEVEPVCGMKLPFMERYAICTDVIQDNRGSVLSAVIVGEGDDDTSYQLGELQVIVTTKGEVRFVVISKAGYLDEEMEV